VGAPLGEPPSLNPADTPVSQASVGGREQVAATPTQVEPVALPPAVDNLPRRSTRQRTTPHSTTSVAIPARRVPVAERWTYTGPCHINA